MKKLLLVLVAVAAIAQCIGAPPRVDQSPSDVSLIRLLAAPEKYDGKRVRVQGVFVLGYEVQVLFPSQDLAITSSNGFWVDRDFSEQLREIAAQKKKDAADEAWFEVRIEATFAAAEHGHLDMCAGGFRAVTRFDWIRRIKPPNQSLEPTPIAGTSAAEQPLVPAAVVAHL